MERILSVEQMRHADNFTINSLGITQEELVERAGSAVADEIYRRFKGGRVLVCIGKGNNGADGKVVAEKLSKIHGFSVSTINIANGFFKLFDKKYDIIVDCIFGTGLNKIVEGKYYQAIEKINNSGAYIISCDIPSGLNGDNGKVLGISVKANLTVAIQEFKLGHFLGDGPDYCGQVIAKDIGISIWGDEFVKRFNDNSLEKFFPKRNRNVNKGCFGKACVIGGSIKYSGSVLLSLNALTSLKMGVGYTNLVVPKSVFNNYLGLNPECLLTLIKDKDGFIDFDKATIDTLLGYDSIAIGMGMGKTYELYQTICYLLDNYTGNLIIDADGLNTIAEFGLEILKNKKCTVVLTPHVLEFSRLSGKDKQEIIENPIKLAMDFAKEYNVILLLKNAVSVITDGCEVYINTTGTPGLAKAGSGDVLSGIICGITARNEDVFSSVVASCYLFGKAGEIATKEQNEYTITATDVISALHKVI